MDHTQHICSQPTRYSQCRTERVVNGTTFWHTVHGNNILFKDSHSLYSPNGFRPRWDLLSPRTSHSAATDKLLWLRALTMSQWSYLEIEGVQLSV